MTIRVHIERLVLEGLPISQSQSEILRAAVIAELGRIIGQGGMPWNTARVVPQVQGGAFSPANSSVKTVGAQIANAVLSVQMK
jgi:hypothetical protein